jgi:hypothetical protein
VVVLVVVLMILVVMVPITGAVEVYQDKVIRVD